MKNLCSGTQCGRFQFLLILDLWDISFHAVVVFGWGQNHFFFKYARTLWCTLCNETALVDWATSTKWGNSKLHCVKSCTKSFFSFQICLHSRNHSLYSCGPDNDLCFRSLLVWITTKSFSFQASKCDLISCTPFQNPQRWMGQNTFPILLLNDDNMIEEH